MSLLCVGSCGGLLEHEISPTLKAFLPQLKPENTEQPLNVTNSSQNI